MAVLDSDARVIGRVEGTFPAAATWDAEFAVVRGRRFGGGHRLLPVTAARFHPGAVQVPFTAQRVAAAPEFDDDRPHRGQADHARAYWGAHADSDARRLGYSRLVTLRD